MENNNDNEKVIIKYSSYTPAQKRATQKYRQNNKEKVNEQRKKYYQERKEKDPDFLKYKREKAKEYYQRKKNNKETEKIIEKVEPHEVLEEIKEEFLKAEPIELKEPVVECVKIKKNFSKKSKKPEIKEDIVKTICDKTELGQMINSAIEEVKQEKKKRVSKKKSKDV